MSSRSPDSRDVLLAVALGSRTDQPERRRLPDRRSGIDRRTTTVQVPGERRSGAERRRQIRRRFRGRRRQGRKLGFQTRAWVVADPE
jgi:hypothetical protein